MAPAPAHPLHGPSSPPFPHLPFHTPFYGIRCPVCPPDVRVSRQASVFRGQTLSWDEGAVCLCTAFLFGTLFVVGAAAVVHRFLSRTCIEFAAPRAPPSLPLTPPLRFARWPSVCRQLLSPLLATVHDLGMASFRLNAAAGHGLRAVFAQQSVFRVGGSRLTSVVCGGALLGAGQLTVVLCGTVTPLRGMAPGLCSVCWGSHMKHPAPPGAIRQRAPHLLCPTVTQTSLRLRGSPFAWSPSFHALSGCWQQQRGRLSVEFALCTRPCRAGREVVL